MALSETRPSAQHVVWHWATPQARTVLDSGDLGAILRFHRTVHGLNQTELGTLLGYDKTYISALELRKKTLGDVGSLRRVAEQLRLPPHVLGVTDPADTDHRAMLQFGQSTVRLAEIARQSGHASEAVAELWPLVARLEARLEDGHSERKSFDCSRMPGWGSVSRSVTSCPRTGWPPQPTGPQRVLVSPPTSTTQPSVATPCGCTEMNCARPALSGPL